MKKEDGKIRKRGGEEEDRICVEARLGK